MKKKLASEDATLVPFERMTGRRRKKNTSTAQKKKKKEKKIIVSDEDCESVLDHLPVQTQLESAKTLRNINLPTFLLL
jgi:hypothetical protein